MVDNVVMLSAYAIVTLDKQSTVLGGGLWIGELT